MSFLSQAKDLFRRGKSHSAKAPQPSRTATAGAARDDQDTSPVVPAAAGAAVIKTGLTPLVTEKGMTAQAKAQTAVFRVKDSATKHDIARAIQEQYHVQPLSIHTVTMRGKRRMRGRSVGFTSQWKKAYVKVADVQKLHITP